MRLNLGCGRHVLDGWMNVDIQVSPRLHQRVPEIISDLRKIPLPDECANEAMAIHVLEHFYRWEVDQVLHEWRRLLKPGGRLILELPDVVKCCHNLINGIEGKASEQMSYWGLYGDPRDQDPYMCHRWGWSPETLKDVLSTRGFVDIVQEIPQWHQVGKFLRDMRIVAMKRS